LLFVRWFGRCGSSVQRLRKKVHYRVGQIQHSAEERRARPASDFCRVYTRDVGEGAAKTAYASAFQDGSDVKAISAMVIKGE
jgi:hypothetical protein